MMKKFVLFIVEGRNDQLEIQAILNTPYFTDFRNKYSPEFLALGKDITLDAPGKQSIRNAVEQVVRKWKKGENRLAQKVSNPLIEEIVHITDLDGVGVTRDSIVQDDVGSFFYEDEIIRAANIEWVVQRNSIKKKNLKDLYATDKIENLPYSIFYASCNMDHVLSNQRNASRQYKDQYSKDYRNLCKANPELIFKSVLAKEIGTDLDYRESWQYIMEGTNSLKRKTNLNLLFEKYGQI